MVAYRLGGPSQGGDTILGVYLDGFFWSQITMTGVTALVPDTNGTIYLGGEPSGHDFTGWVDEFKVFSREPTDEEISATPMEP